MTKQTIMHRAFSDSLDRGNGRSLAAGRRTAEEVVLLGLCLSGALALLPVVFLHYQAGQGLLVGIDASLIVINVSIALYVGQTHRLRHAGVLFVITYMAAILASLYLAGPGVVYWAFPAMAVAYFFIPLGAAIAINATVMALMAPVLGPALPLLDLYRVVASLAVLNIVACLFARHMIEHRALLSSLATRDPLTGVGNRRALESRMREMVALHERRGGAMSLLLLDVDFFKLINDEMGHSRGDDVLVALTRVISERIRLTDGLYRLGGDEFVVLLNETGIDDASRFAEHLRGLVEQSAQRLRHRVTVSIGVATLAKGETREAWLERADLALYAAKQGGRNMSKVA